MLRHAALLALLPPLALPAAAQDAGSGLFARGNREELPPIAISAEKPLAAAPLDLKSGRYYEVEFEADGSAELAIEGPDFFRAIWIDEIVISDIEIRPMGGIDSIEFDDEGTVELSFIALKPGSYVLQLRGAKTDDRRLRITIE